MKAPTFSTQSIAVRAGTPHETARVLPEEVPVAIVVNGSTQAVMMATPADLEDFALGFALTDHVIAAPAEVEGIEVVEQEAGIEARLWLIDERAEAVAARRRSMAGPVGCGLCGIESLEEAVRPVVPLPAGGLVLMAADVEAAVEGLQSGQPLRDRTRATHGAGFYVPGQGVVLTREDVGRHNALDKVIGALLRQGIDPASGALVISSRVSVEMVQKAAASGSPVLVALATPTALAVRTAEAAGLTLAAQVRDGGFDLYAHPGRISFGEKSDVA